MEHVEIDKKKAKILLLFIIIIFGLLVFVLTLLHWSNSEREKIPNLKTSDKNTAVRGDILSADGYTIATSKKLYTARVDVRSIDKKKIDLFANLYAIYANDKPHRIKHLIQNNKKNVILSHEINAKIAKHLKELSRKLYRMRVFKSYINPKTQTAITKGIDILENGEKRIYPNKDMLSPFVGHVTREYKGKKINLKGLKGIEYSYNDKLVPIQDGLIVGHKDIGNNIILNRDSKKKERLDGFSVVLSVSVKLQKAVEKILDEYKTKLNAKEIVAAVIKSDTGEFLTLASSNRFDPNHIRKKDYKLLNPSITEYSYEPGSVIKPITLAILLREDKVDPYELVNTHKGRYRLGKSTIQDSHSYAYLTAEDVIVHSSNIGILQLAQRLKPTEYFQGLKDFGFSLKSGIDLPYEHNGIIPSLKRFRSDIYKATVGYGYGMRATFIQILKAYNVFNYKGRLVTPYIGVYLLDKNGKKYSLPRPQQMQVLPISIAKRMKKILVKVVKKGTGKNADVEGLEIGGKTGTAHIASKNGGYANKYNGSFMGFANDANNSFTIGVWTREPRKKYHYFGSQSAAPVFKKIVQTMVSEGFLTPKDTNQSK